MVRTMRWLAVIALCVLACGRTEPLRFPFVPTDGGVDAGQEQDAGPLPCVPGVVTLVRARPTVMFVLDRSGSMGFAFGGGLSRWRALEQGLSNALPPVDETMAIGAYVFPTATSSSCVAPMAADLLPAVGNVTRLVQLMARSQPRGGTPTADALNQAAEALRGVRAARSARALVLATDGAPGCNAMLDPNTCVCTTTPQSCTITVDNCLDDVRTLSRMNAITASGLPTWVIGIENGSEPLLANVLDRMAVAGGRPRAASPHYYRATSPDQLQAALVDIRDQVGACTYLTASVPDAQGDIRVFLNGKQVAENPTTGWTWVDRANGELVFTGGVCTQSAGAVVTANVGCSGP